MLLSNVISLLDPSPAVPVAQGPLWGRKVWGPGVRKLETGLPILIEASGT